MDLRDVLGFDVYGTLVDPLELATQLRPLAGANADALALLWRQKQLEYAFRRAAMRRYENFDECTRRALQFAAQSLGLALDDEQQQQLLQRYRRLNPYPDAFQGLRLLRERKYRLFAFSNGIETSVRELLRHADLLDQLDGVMSVDDLRTFKPDPAVYHHLRARGGLPPERTWLISSNPWDVIGAKAAGLRAVWVKRRAEWVFDPWEFEPDLVVSDLLDLADRLAGAGSGSAA